MDLPGILTGIGAILVPGGSILLGLKTVKNTKKATADTAQARLDAAESAYTKGLKGDLEQLKAEFREEKLDRRSTEIELWKSLNAYRVRDAAWWSLFPRMNLRIIECGGEPFILPSELQQWIEMPAAPKA